MGGIGKGVSESPDRAREAVNLALNNPLLDVDYSGATGGLIQVIGGDDMRLEEINKVGEIVSSYLDPTAQVMWGARIMPEFKHKLQVITIITGVKSPYIIGSAKTTHKKSELGIEMLDK